jgi:PAS domain S-box-containing protein
MSTSDLSFWLFPTPTGDVGQDRNARTLQVACYVFAVGFALVAFLNSISGEQVNLPLHLSAVLGLVASAILNKTGNWKWAVRLAVFFALLNVITLVLEARDGFRSHAMVAFPGLLLLSVLLFDRASYFVVSALILLSVAALGIAEIHGLAPFVPLARTSANYSSVAFLDLFLLAMAFVGGRIARDFQNNVSDLRTGIRDLSATILELQRSQDALRQSESRAQQRAAELQAIMDAAPVAILVTHDSDSRYLGGNRAAYALLRQPPGSNLSKHPPQGERPVNFRLLRDGIEIPLEEIPSRRAAATGRPVRNSEIEVLFEDGASIDLIGNAEPLFGEEGCPCGAVAVFSDITERKRAGTLLRAITENSPDPIFVKDRDCRFLLANPAALDVIGCTAEEVLGKTLEEVLADPFLGRWMTESDRLVMDSGQTLFLEQAIPAPGGVHTFLVAKRPYCDAVGSIIGVIGIARDITERKRAETELRQSEERFHNMADSAPVMIWITGPDKLCVYCNKPWLEFTGRTMEQELGNGWIQGVHPKDLDRCFETYSSAFDARRTFQMEYRVRRKEGAWRWLLSTGTPLYREGVFVGYIGSCIDVTERKLMEDRLRASETLLKHAQRLAAIGSWEATVEGDGIRWSDEMFRIFGVDGAPLRFADVLSRIPCKERDNVRELHAKLRSGISPAGMDHRIVRADGEVRFVRLLADALRDRQGAVARIVGAVQDITEQVKAGEFLRDSEERLKNAERIAHIGNWRWDFRSGRVVWSEELFRILGLGPEIALSREQLVQSTVPRDRNRVDEWLKHCLESGAGNSLEFQIARPNGELRTVACAIEVARDEDGTPVQVSGTAQDVTDFRRVQEEVLSRQKLESVGTLAGGIAHDFNNLLGAVLVQAEFAIEESETGLDPREELQRIREIAIHGADIVRQLMIYAGKESEVAEPVNLSQIVSEMLSLLKLSISKHATLETDLNADIPPVLANAAQLRQVVMNLVTNASEAIGTRDGVISVSTRSVAGGDYVQLQISDTGKGMTCETQARVFDPFFTTKTAGHGLGLAVVHGIVRNLHGTIQLESEPGKGTTFQILLPSTEPVKSAGHASKSAPASLPNPHPTVLFVEDEHALRQPVAKMLRRSGFEVLEAADGTQAIDLLRDDGAKIDVLLLDITIPGRPSDDVVAEAERLRPGLKVLLTSAYSEEMVMARVPSPLARAFIRKPFQLADVLQKLQDVLASSEIQQPH